MHRTKYKYRILIWSFYTVSLQNCFLSLKHNELIDIKLYLQQKWNKNGRLLLSSCDGTKPQNIVWQLSGYYVEFSDWATDEEIKLIEFSVSFISYICFSDNINEVCDSCCRCLLVGQSLPVKPWLGSVNSPWGPNACTQVECQQGLHCVPELCFLH